MILIFLISTVLAGGLASALLGPWRPVLARWASLAALSIGLASACVLWALNWPGRLPVKGPWLASFRADWIPQLGIRLHLEMDGLSLLLVILTFFLGIAAVLASWSGITRRVASFHISLMAVLAGLLGVFLAADLFLLCFAWELVLVPMVLLIRIWGHENRAHASIKLLIFTQVSGLLMLLSTIALAVLHARVEGELSFDFFALLETARSLETGGDAILASWLFLGFLAAFLLHLAAVPFHAWFLHGLVLVTGAYGLLRFVLPFFPQTSAAWAPWLMGLGAAGIIHAAVLAFARSGIQRLIAHSSMSHMGFALLGIFSGERVALEGVVVLLICHWIGAGAMDGRIHTMDLRPRAVSSILAMAALSFPALGSLVGEVLVLAGAYRQHPAIAIIAAAGLIPATLYPLWKIQKALRGPRRGASPFRDLSRRELAISGVMAASILALGLHPAPVLETVRPVLESLERLPPITSRPGEAPGTRPSRRSFPARTRGGPGARGGTS